MNNSAIEKVKIGYARILDVPKSSFEQNNLTYTETKVRDAPEWANWVHPIWFFAMNDSVICSVSPRYGTEAKTLCRAIEHFGPLSAEMLEHAQSLLYEGVEWVQCELFYYPFSRASFHLNLDNVVTLVPGSPSADRLLRLFDGGVFAICDPSGAMLSHAGVKNKGILNEIAVGTHEAHRKKGLGRSVVACAVSNILLRGCVPTYWPDSLDNEGSYALARSLGFVKGGEMLFCCYEQSGWAGFPIQSTNQPIR